MTLLLSGLVVFLGAHAFTMFRAPRAAAVGRLGEGGYRGAYSLVSMIGLALIILGYASYRTSGYIAVFEPPTAMRHIALVLLLPVFPLLAAAYLPGLIKTKAKHPMLAAVKIWALAHLLANGDLGSLILFLSFLAWAVVARISAKRRVDEGHGVSEQPAAAGWTTNDTIAVVVGLAVYLAFVFWLHPLLIGVPVLSR